MNVIYRDLKAENIVVDEDGYLALIDFGISRKIEPNVRVNSFIGTTEYMAPEFFDEDEDAGYSIAVDWWALGVLTYEQFVGYPPFFDGQSNIRKLKKKITTQ